MIETIRDWLKKVGLDQHVQLFESNDVDLATLRILTEDDLKELGLSFGARKRIVAALREEQGGGPSAPAPVAAAKAAAAAVSPPVKAGASGRALRGRP